nr:MAG TPA: hypothetical protein [Caudoviricetes sp.]
MSCDKHPKHRRQGQQFLPDSLSLPCRIHLSVNQ